MTIREQAYRSLVDNLPDNIVRWDTAGRYVYINTTHEQTLGKAAADVMGKTIEEVFPDGLFRVIEAAIAQTISAGQAVLFARQAVPVNGKTEIHDIKFVPERDANGQVISVLGIGRDMTEFYRVQDNLAARERELRALAESSPGMMGSYHLRSDGSICMPYVSPKIEKLFGLRPQDVAHDASALMALTHPDDAQRVADSIAESARCMSTWHQEYRIAHPTLGERWMESHTHPEPHPDGGIVWYGYVHDITERKQTQRRMELLERAVNQSSESFFLMDEKFRFRYVNETACRSLGYSQEELLSMWPLDIDPVMTPEVALEARRKTPSGQTLTFETQHRARDGSMRPVELSSSDFMEGGNKWALVVARDITERKQAELEREYLRDQLRGMAAQREEVREEERRHIAREVHDELGQILSALKINLIVLARKFSPDAPALRDQLAQTTVLIDEAIGVARNIATTLRPVALNLGFVPALEWLAQSFESNTGVPIEIHAQSKVVELDEQRAIALFRIVQEALTNVTRHAQAQRVTIILKQDAGDHLLIVRDDGKGFDTRANKPNSFGLVGMKERALILKGALSITSQVGGGTEITVRIPTQVKEDAL